MGLGYGTSGLVAMWEQRRALCTGLTSCVRRFIGCNAGCFLDLCILSMCSRSMFVDRSDVHWPALEWKFPSVVLKSTCKLVRYRRSGRYSTEKCRWA